MFLAQCYATIFYIKNKKQNASKLRETSLCIACYEVLSVLIINETAIISLLDVVVV